MRWTTDENFLDIEVCINNGVRDFSVMKQVVEGESLVPSWHVLITESEDKLELLFLSLKFLDFSKSVKKFEANCILFTFERSVEDKLELFMELFLIRW